MSMGRWKCHCDCVRCQHAARQWRAAGSSSSHQSCKSACVPAGDQPADIPSGTTHGSGEQRSVSVNVQYAMVFLPCRFIWEKIMYCKKKEFCNSLDFFIPTLLYNTEQVVTFASINCVYCHQLWLLWSFKAQSVLCLTIDFTGIYSQI